MSQSLVFASLFLLLSLSLSICLFTFSFSKNFFSPLSLSLSHCVSKSKTVTGKVLWVLKLVCCCRCRQQPEPEAVRGRLGHQGHKARWGVDRIRAHWRQPFLCERSEKNFDIGGPYHGYWARVFPQQHVNHSGMFEPSHHIASHRIAGHITDSYVYLIRTRYLRID